jgi:hypothetical protein
LLSGYAGFAAFLEYRATLPAFKQEVQMVNRLVEPLTRVRML